MKIISKGITPDGVRIQLEAWPQATKNSTELSIGAYPTAKNTSKHKFIASGEPFRLTIARCYTSNDEVSNDYHNLLTGKTQISDLSEHFWNGLRDEYFLGIMTDLVPTY